ncbi:methyltransferase family protein [Virgibacillus salexigens]|uniref:methyltransferase family protein n=1 Tax=Virgibacillus salexigens TaxID=61016 RepID=UPI00190E35B4|nr:DUF1295 domain-containing protein [Virgibacillus salexigens]
MNLYRKKEQSRLQKWTVIGLETLILFLAAWLLFFADEQLSLRNFLLFGLFLIVYGRMYVTIFYLLKRKMPWQEAMTIPVAFSLYYIGFSIFTLITDKPVDLLDIGSILLFLIGSFINTYSEIQRDRWKREPAHKGGLYTEGLFTYAMHINYFGDLVWVTALALFTRSTGALIIPIILFCFFAWYNIPILDTYLADKYGEQFKRYKQSTNKLIPFLY